MKNEEWIERSRNERDTSRNRGMSALARAEVALADAIMLFHNAGESNLILRQVKADLDEEIEALTKDEPK